MNTVNTKETVGVETDTAHTHSTQREAHECQLLPLVLR